MRHPSDVLSLDPSPARARSEALHSPRLTVGVQRGDTVEVRCRFNRSWARGFVVAEVRAGGVFLRRTSDDALLPVAFDAADVRLASPVW